MVRVPSKSLLLKIKNANSVLLFYCVFLLFYMKKNKALLEQIKNFFNFGSITKQRLRSIEFRVQSIKYLRVILDYFDKYILITDKWSDYKLLKQAFQLILSKEHLTIQGLCKIVAIKASMNRGISPELKSVFTSVVRVTRPLVKEHQISTLISRFH